MGIPAPVAEEETPLATGAVEVGTMTPEVKGTPAEPVPVAVKAGGCMEAVVSGLAVALPGLRTL